MTEEEKAKVREYLKQQALIEDKEKEAEKEKIAIQRQLFKNFIEEKRKIESQEFQKLKPLKQGSQLSIFTLVTLIGKSKREVNEVMGSICLKVDTFENSLLSFGHCGSFMKEYPKSISFYFKNPY